MLPRIAAPTNVSQRVRPEPSQKPDDDLLPGDLPALDGAEGDETEDERDANDPERLAELDALDGDDGDPFDDATGEDDAVPELMGEDQETTSLLDSGVPDDLDVGAADLLGRESDRVLDDTAGSWEDDEDEEALDYGLTEDGLSVAGDAGEEGPTAVDETLTDDGLPPLGADADDASEDSALEDAASFFDGELGTERPDAWSAPWERFGTPFALPPLRTLVRSTSGVVAGGRELVRVDLEGGVAPVAARGLRGGEITGIVLSGEDAFVTTETGGLFVARGGFRTFAEVSAWRRHVRPEEAAAGLDVVASPAAGVWGRTAQGSLLSSPDGGAHWEKADVDGFVRAIGVDDDGQPVLLVRTLATNAVLRRAGDAWTRCVLPPELLEGGLAGPAIVVARGRTMAVAVDGYGTFRSLDGAAWSRLLGVDAVTALALLDDRGTLVAAQTAGAAAVAGERAASKVTPEGESDAESLHGPSTTLLRVGADGQPQVVGVLHATSEVDLTVMAITVDESHRVVWVAGGFGLEAFQPRLG